MNTTSLSLLGRASSGRDHDAWDRLASIYQPLLHGWLGRYALQRSDVDDLVQDVLLALYRELPSFEHSGRTGAFRNWLKTILIHRLQNFWRARKHRPASVAQRELLERLDQLHDPTSDASRVWDAEHDRHVLARLTEIVRPRFQEHTWRAFERQVFGGVRADLVAAELGMSVQSAYVARSRVLHALRQEAAGLVDE